VAEEAEVPTMVEVQTMAEAVPTTEAVPIMDQADLTMDQAVLTMDQAVPVGVVEVVRRRSSLSNHLIMGVAPEDVAPMAPPTPQVRMCPLLPMQIASVTGYSTTMGRATAMLVRTVQLQTGGATFPPR